MTYALTSNGCDTLRDTIISSLLHTFDEHGITRSRDTNGIQFVIHPIDASSPAPYRRRSQSVIVISIVRIRSRPDDLKGFCYTTLIRSLSNLLVCIVAPDGVTTPSDAEVYFTTPEAGFYGVTYDDHTLFSKIYPIATAHYSTANTLVDDLPERYWSGSPKVDELRTYARELDTLGVLPTPFPLRELLPEADMRHLYRMFGMTGLSYGNLSVRERIPGFSERSFWMTARGVDKAHLGPVGRDILLVRSFSYDEGTAHISMPPDGWPKARVSVDAVEHAMIYDRYPDVGAIVHVHAWMDDIVSTRQNFPCGTRELAQEVSDLLAQTADPRRAVAGLKNHGITVTGVDLEDIFRRLRQHLLTEVPMYS